jgi:hypothetical protein
MTQQQLVIESLELHLYFGRIMKEHALFLEAGFTPQNSNFSKSADQFKVEFEKLLQNAIALSNGIVGANVLRSGELITEFTMDAERQTQAFTGIMINQGLTVQTSRLQSGVNPNITPELARAVRELNAGAMQLLNAFIDFKTQILNNVLSCSMFTLNYPLLIEHILREAKMYRDNLTLLESGRDIDENARNLELFWDRIMLEHALFIRGLLDPSEGELVNTANDFAAEYNELLRKTMEASDTVLASVTDETLADTKRYRDFKAAGTKGIAQCQIRSIILPLLGDHVLREANHYIRLLEEVR